MAVKRISINWVAKLNDSKGVFTQQMVFQGHPLYGHS